jgi:glycosyltransferase involved in cell wall biosynthesis
MKLLIVTELYTPSTGGQQLRYTEMAEALVTAGHEVRVFCIRHAAELPIREIRNGVRIYRHPLAPNYLKPLIKAARRRIWPLFRFALWSRLRMLQGDHDAVIFNQWPVAHVLLAPRAHRRAGMIDWCEVRQSTLFSLIQRYLPRVTSGNMAVSSPVQSHIATVSGRHVAFVPSGVHCSRYRSHARSERRNLVYLGRVAEHKNLCLLVAAFEILKTRGYPHGLEIAGSGPGMDALRRRVAASPNASSISLLGYVSNLQKVTLLATSEVLVVPSRREGFPRVVAEAMASGLPTVTAAYPGNGTAAVVRQYGCGEVSSDDPLDMALKIEAVLENWAAYSQVALERCQELVWARVIPNIEDLIGRTRRLASSDASAS